jgi:hyperosmotically inducible periplasmic protein
MKRHTLAFIVAVAALAVPPALLAANESTAPPAEGSSQPVKDAYVKSKILGSYAVNPHVSALKLDVRVENGVAYLGGNANTGTERDLAIEIARGTDGVREVRSQIAVAPRTAQAERSRRTAGEALDDATITAQVKGRLIANDSTPGTKINVTTRNGVVTLTGVVEDDAQKDLAGRVAENTEHVKAVHNEINVANR